MREHRGVLALVDNLFFASKIEHAARAAGADLHLASDAQAFAARLQDAGADLVLVDMASAAPWRDLIRDLKARPTTRNIPVVAFGKHTRAEDFRAARQVGCDRAITNAQLSEQLPEILQTYLDDGEAASPDRQT